MDTKNLFTLTKIAVFLSLLMPQFAAAEAQHFPGAACLPDSHKDNFSRIYSGKIKNTSTGVATYTCAGHIPWSIYRQKVDGYVWVEDRHYSKNATCVLKTRYPNGAGYRTSTRNSANTGYKKLSFSSIWNNSQGSTFIRCSLPGTYNGYTSRIVSYRMWN